MALEDILNDFEAAKERHFAQQEVEEQTEEVKEQEEVQEEVQTEETEEEVNENEEEIQEGIEEESKPEKEAIKINVNGAEVELSQEQLIALAQEAAANKLTTKKAGIEAELGLTTEDLLLMKKIKEGDKAALASLVSDDLIDELDELKGQELDLSTEAQEFEIRKQLEENVRLAEETGSLPLLRGVENLGTEDELLAVIGNRKAINKLSEIAKITDESTFKSIVAKHKLAGHDFESALVATVQEIENLKEESSKKKNQQGEEMKRTLTKTKGSASRKTKPTPEEIRGMSLAEILKLDLR